MTATYLPLKKLKEKNATATKSQVIEFDVHTPPADLRTMVVPPQEYAITPLYPRNCVAAFIGEGKGGKSTMLLRQMIFMSCGRQWEGLTTQCGPVWYFSAEDPADRVWERAQAVINGEQFTPEEFAKFRENFKLINAVGRSLYFTAVEGGATVPSDVARQISACVGKAIFIAVDTVSRINSGNENDNAVMSAIVKAAESIAQSTDAAVCLVHHTSKQSARGRSTDAYSHRGASSLADNSRSYIRLIKADDKAVARFDAKTQTAQVLGDIMQLIHVHVSYGKKWFPTWWRRLSDGRLERFEPTGDTLGALVRWFIDPQGGKREPFTCRLIETKRNEIWADGGPGRNDLRRWIAQAIEKQELLPADGNAKGGRRYTVSPGAIRLIEELDENAVHEIEMSDEDFLGE